MNSGWIALVGLVGPLSLSIMFVFLGLISRRLGRVTRSSPYYIGFFVASVLVAISVMARLFHLGQPEGAFLNLGQQAELLVLYTGFPALGITIAAFVTWHYWSWLLAERN